MKIDVAGIEMEVNLPEGAIVTGAVLYVNYQRIDSEGDACAGMRWYYSAMPIVTALGMAHAGLRYIERVLDEP